MFKRNFSGEKKQEGRLYNGLFNGLGRLCGLEPRILNDSLYAHIKPATDEDIQEILEEATRARKAFEKIEAKKGVINEILLPSARPATDGDLQETREEATRAINAFEALEAKRLQKGRQDAA